MTIIAYRDGIMAADSAVFDGDTYAGEVRKIHRLPDGSLLGTAGALAMAKIAADWLSGPMEGSPPDLREGSLYGILVRSNGDVFSIDRNLIPMRFKARFYAEGSGCSVALGAMAAGAPASEAALIACTFDAKCRGPVQVERIG
jgi:ATP-dependent protease HslVU (ClpYQ) peptidase subunit